ncbi:MAG: GIY-YIG nuclease family protein [Dehalococcoidia bacterium]
MYILYVLLSGKDGDLYTGIAANVDKRLQSTTPVAYVRRKVGAPFFLLYTEEFATRSEAYAREVYLKTPEGGTVKQRLVQEARKRGDHR